MRILKIFLTVLILFFSSFSLAAEKEQKTVSGKETSLYNLLLKLETDLKEKKSQSEILKDLELIKKAKEELPVSYIPELNYLVKPGVEEVPATEITLFKKLTYYIYPLETAIKVFLFLLLFYTFIFYFQNIEVQPLVKRILTTGSVAFLVFAFVVNICALIYFVSGFGFILITVLKRKKLGFYFLSAVFLFFVSQIVWENAALRLKSDNLFYYVKVVRDGYVPHYLIDRVFSDKISANVEKATSDLALGKLDAVLSIKSVRTNDPFLKVVIYNDLGYVSFLQGKYEAARDYFEKALKLSSIPEIEYNLYLSFSSLVKLEEANRLKDKLLKRGIPVEKLPPVPLLVHLPVELPGYVFPVKFVVAFAAGILAGFVFARFFVATFGNFESDLLLILGFRSFINSKVRPFILVSVGVFIVNVLLGKLICSV